MRTTRHLLHAAVAVLVLCLVTPAAYASAGSGEPPNTGTSGPSMHGNNGSPPPPWSLFTSPRRRPVFEFSPAPLLDSDVALIDLLDSPIAFLALDAGGVPSDSNIDIDIDFDDLGGLTPNPAYPTELVGSPAAGAIPSPGALGLLALAALTVRRRRRRA